MPAYRGRPLDERERDSGGDYIEPGLDACDTSAYDAEKLTLPPYLLDCPETRRDLTKYYAEITYLDGQLGDCMKIVDASGQADNTIVAFTSEQGTSFPSGGKWTCYDTGLKTAFIVRWPARVKAGTRLGEEVAAAAAEVGGVAGATLGQRVVFAETLGQGLGASEARGAAAGEVALLADEVLELLG